MAIASLFPAIKPSLNLDFANTKSLDPRITFSRASAATYYDGKTVAKAEENLLLQSSYFAQNWNQGAVALTSNAGPAPDSTNTASSIVGDGTNTQHRFYQVSTLSAGFTYTFSVYAKAGSGNFIQLSIPTGLVSYANFDLSLGVVGSSGGIVSSSISSLGGGWYRCAIVTTAVSSSAGSSIICLIGSSSDSYYPANTLNTSVYIWGAQLEQRSQVTAYTPTTTQPITNYIPVLQTAPAGVPRFDHNPVTGESLGLLVEEQRTNLLRRSQDFTAELWSKGGSSLNILGVAPDGSVSASRLTEDSTLSVHTCSQPTASTVGSTTYTFSVYVKPYGRNFIQLWSSGGSPRFGAKFDLANKSSTALANVGAALLTGRTIEDVGNGWYRISISGSNGVDAVFSSYILLDNGTSNLYQGDGYSGIYIWGAQLEAGTFPTSYIETEASQVTRAADSASMTGTNFSSWYRQDEGSLFTESISNSISPFDSYIASIQGSNVDNSIRLGQSANGVARRFNIRVNATNILALDVTPSSVAGVPYKQAAGYKIGDCAAVSNGSNVLTLAPGNLPYSLDRLHIGVASHSVTIKKVAYYSKKLTNAQLQALTA